jgi:hypothetical protein
LKVNGRDLMDHFELEASPTIGKTIAYLFDVVEETPSLNTKEGLLRLAKEFLREQEETNGNHSVDSSGTGASEGAAG